MLYIPPCLAIQRASRRWGNLKTEMEKAQSLLNLARQGEIRSLPSQEALPELLQELNVQAKKFQVNIQSLTPGRSSAPDPGQPVLLPVELQLEGEYRAIGEFLGALHNVPSLGMVTIRRLQIGREERLLPRLRAQLSIHLALQQEAADGP